MTKWKELFNFLEKKCNFHEKEKGNPESVVWTCFGDLRFTKEFCESKGLDYKNARDRLAETGGYCDCEVLFNSIKRIDEEEKMKAV